MSKSADTNRHIVYARSNRGRGRQAEAQIKQHLALLLEMARAESLNVVQIVTEIGSASGRAERPAFTALLNHIRKGEADGILCISIDRLARSISDAGQIIALVDDGALKRIYTRGVPEELAPPFNRH